jgi:dTDP-N-acetylfucosamine:lipid II N-acetylfucosaminyltransferase
MPGLHHFHSSGNKIMIGHSASPEGNHYEIIHRLNRINPAYPIFLPLSYGDKQYGNLIKTEAQKKFINVDVLEEPLERDKYYEKLTEVGWAIINVKVQQAVGNIIALIWMGCKVFLDKSTSTYKDFLTSGIIVYSIQDNLNEFELASRLNPDQMENNRKKILEEFNEETINKQWNEFLY